MCLIPLSKTIPTINKVMADMVPRANTPKETSPEEPGMKNPIIADANNSLDKSLIQLAVRTNNHEKHNSAVF